MEICEVILLCNTGRYLLKSQQLRTISNRLQHSEPYWFGVELETAIGEKANIHIPPMIITGECNILFYNELDNLNNIKTNVTGNNKKIIFFNDLYFVCLSSTHYFASSSTQYFAFLDPNQSIYLIPTRSSSNILNSPIFAHYAWPDDRL